MVFPLYVYVKLLSLSISNKALYLSCLGAKDATQSLWVTLVSLLKKHCCHKKPLKGSRVANHGKRFCGHQKENTFGHNSG